jgi:hypothetical protein
MAAVAPLGDPGLELRLAGFPLLQAFDDVDRQVAAGEQRGDDFEIVPVAVPENHQAVLDRNCGRIVGMITRHSSAFPSPTPESLTLSNVNIGGKSYTANYRAAVGI